MCLVLPKISWNHRRYRRLPSQDIDDTVIVSFTAYACYYGDGYFGLRHLLKKFVGVEVLYDGYGATVAKRSYIDDCGPRYEKHPGTRGTGQRVVTFTSGKLPINEAEEETMLRASLLSFGFFSLLTSSVYQTSKP